MRLRDMTGHHCEWSGDTWINVGAFDSWKRQNYSFCSDRAEWILSTVCLDWERPESCKESTSKCGEPFGVPCHSEEWEFSCRNITSVKLTKTMTLDSRQTTWGQPWVLKISPPAFPLISHTYLAVSQAMDDQAEDYTLWGWPFETCHLWVGSLHRGLPGASAPRMCCIWVVL